MASHKISISNGQVEGLSNIELQSLLNFAAKNPGMQQVIGQVAQKVQESIEKDTKALKRFVERGQVSQADAYILLEEYHELSTHLRTLNENLWDDTKAFGKEAYHQAGVAVGQAQRAIGKAVVNVLSWIKAHPKLAVGLCLTAFIIMGPMVISAHASSPLTINTTELLNGVGTTTRHDLFATSGKDLMDMMLAFADPECSPELKDKIMKSLKLIGTDSLLVLPDGSALSGKGVDLLSRISEIQSYDGVVLISKNAIPGTGAVGPYSIHGVINNVVSGAIKLPK